MTEQELAEILERAEKATPGPWTAYSSAWMVGSECGLIADTNEYGDSETKASAPNCAFIAYARDDVPALVAEVKRLRAELEQKHKKCPYVVSFAADPDEGALHTCGKCGAELQIVRPGKWQCPNCE